MNNIDLKISVSDLTLALIEELRDGRPREEIMRHALELGLCELVESMTRTHRDFTMHRLAGQTKDYRNARHAMFAVNEPQASKGEDRNEQFRVVAQRETRG